MAAVMALKFCTSVTKGLKLKVRKFLGLTSTCVEETGRGGGFLLSRLIHSAKNEAK